MSTIQECIDCKAYEDVTEPDAFLRPFGDNAHICPLCAEARGIDAMEFHEGAAAPLEIGDYARADYVANIRGDRGALDGVVTSIAEPHSRFNSTAERCVSVRRPDGTEGTASSTMPVHRLHPASHLTAQAAIRRLLASHAHLSDRTRAALNACLTTPAPETEPTA